MTNQEYLIYVCVFAAIGAAIGYFKDRMLFCAFACAALGPIGLILILFEKDFRTKCPYCKEVIKKGATVCWHCGSQLNTRDRKQVHKYECTCPLCGNTVLLDSAEPRSVKCPHCDGDFDIE